jgi:arylsulfatase A-like enzyme
MVLAVALGAPCVAQERPNILLMVAEDMSHRLGSFGDTVARTPNLDELARRSVRFPQTFTTAGVCAPSRAALITGQHQISFGAQHMRTTTGPLGPYLALPAAEVKAFPELLRQAGYYTMNDGKLDYQFSGIRANSGPPTIWDQEGSRDWSSRPSDQPFFAMINFMETHESGIMATQGEPYSQSHERTMVMRRSAELIAPAVTDPADVSVPPYYPDVPEVRADMARHYDNIHLMDARAGELLAKLKAEGLDTNTIVIWTTDHGDGLPRAKRELYDSGIRVPLMIHFPENLAPADWKEGTVDSRLISFVDLAPTILTLAGVSIPAYYHGDNLLTSQRQYVYASRDRIDEVVDRQRAIRDARYKYVRSWFPLVASGHKLTYRDNLTMVRAMRAMYEQDMLNAAQRLWFEPAGVERLYDLVTDPYELDNLAGHPDLQGVRKRLSKALTAWQAEIGDTSHVPEVAMRERFLDHGEIVQTPVPTMSEKDGWITISAVPGASIEYRIDDGRWQLYVRPVENVSGRVKARAVRYGWRTSSTTELVIR